MSRDLHLSPGFKSMYLFGQLPSVGYRLEKSSAQARSLSNEESRGERAQNEVPPDSGPPDRGLAKALVNPARSILCITYFFIPSCKAPPPPTPPGRSVCRGVFARLVGHAASWSYRAGLVILGAGTLCSVLSTSSCLYNSLSIF